MACTITSLTQVCGERSWSSRSNCHVVTSRDAASKHATAIPVNRSKRTVPNRTSLVPKRPQQLTRRGHRVPRGRHLDRTAEQFKQNLNPTSAVQALQYAERTCEWTRHKLDAIAKNTDPRNLARILKENVQIAAEMTW